MNISVVFVGVVVVFVYFVFLFRHISHCFPKAHSLIKSDFNSTIFTSFFRITYKPKPKPKQHTQFALRTASQAYMSSLCLLFYQSNSGH